MGKHIKDYIHGRFSSSYLVRVASQIKKKYSSMNSNSKEGPEFLERNCRTELDLPIKWLRRQMPTKAIKW